MKNKVFYMMAMALVFLAGCQKEKSFEQGNAPSEGSLQSDVSGDCLPKTVNGTYEAGTALTVAHTIAVSVDVTKTGTYLVNTDTVNGIYFRATGTFTSTGANTITLRGNGTPFAAGTFNFVVSYNGTLCDIQITVLPSGAGGPAQFTIESSGTPANCSGATAAGNYIIGTALNSSNTVTLSVNVTTIGTYTVTTTATNGMTFSKTGVFTTTGVQPLVLTGSGTPTGTPGPVTISVTAGSSTCSFQVTTVAGATFSFNCATAVVNGTYQANVALGSSNTVDIDLNVLTTGPYNISTTATNGMTFTASGNFTTTGVINIQLVGSGTPAAAGTFNIPVPGTTSCTFPVTCTAAPVVNWSFKQGTTTFSGTTTTVSLQVLGAFTNFSYIGTNTASETLVFSLVDLVGGIGAEQYNTNSTTNNSGAFIFTTAGGDTWSSDPTVTGTNVTFSVTSHNTTTKTITGTFTGTVKNGAGTVLSINTGTFTAVYP